MASIIRRNKRRWKGVKWIDTPFATKRKALASIMCRAVLARGMYQVSTIRQALCKNEHEMAQKKIALAEAIIATHEAASATWKKIVYKRET